MSDAASPTEPLEIVASRHFAAWLAEERVSLAFQSSAIDVAVLEDLVRLVLGRSAAFLRRAPLVGIHGQTG